MASLPVDDVLYGKFKAYCNKNNFKLTPIVNEAIEWYMKSKGVKA